MGQEVLDAFWKSNDRIYNENTLLYHRLARACGLPDCAFWLLYTLRSEEAPLTQTQLSEQLSLPKQTVNSALKKLVEEGSPPLGGGGRQSEKQAGLSDRGGRGIPPPHCGPRVRRRERRGRPPDRGGAVGACGIEPEAAGCLSGGDGSFFTDRCDRRLMYADQTF